MFVEIAPAAPDLFLHQSVDVMEMDRLHRLEELKRHVKKARLLFRR
jgi:hypothetical protein